MPTNFRWRKRKRQSKISCRRDSWLPDFGTREMWGNPLSFHWHRTTNFGGRSGHSSKEETGGEGGIRTLGTGVSPYNGLANRRIRPLCHLSATILDSLPRCICGLLLPAARCFLRTDRAPRMLLRRVGLAQIHLVRAHERSMGGELICRTHLLYDRDSPVTGREKVSNPTWVKMTH